MAQNVFLTEAQGGAIIQMEVGTKDYVAVAGTGGVARGDKSGSSQDLDNLEAPNFRWLSKPYSPAGESGICVFRRLYFAIRHNAGFTVNVVPYVDGKELLKKDGTTSQQREVTIDAPPSGGTSIEYVEVPINGRGTSLQVKLQTAACEGEFSLEGFAIGYRAERGVLLDNAES